MWRRKRKESNICHQCSKSKHPAIKAARLGHEACLVTAYRTLGVSNERDDYGATPIHYAARSGQLGCLKWLVQHSGISPNAVAKNGATAAHDAAAMGQLECLKYLTESTRCSVLDVTSEGATVLHIACRFGQTTVTKWLLDNTSASPSDKGANNVTPVHISAAKNNVRCLKSLTQHTSYVPNERTVHGATPLYFAAQEGSVECLEWLIKHSKGDPHMNAFDGMSPVHAAAQVGNVGCLQVLVECGVSPRQRSDEGATPAHYAAASGHVKCLKWILDNGGSLTDKDNLGGLPLHDAADQGQAETVALLIKRGASVNVEDFDGLKPFDLAKENNHKECMKILFKAIKPDILTSLTPHHSFSRSSRCSDDEGKAIALDEDLFQERWKSKNDTLFDAPNNAGFGGIHKPPLNVSESVMSGTVMKNEEEAIVKKSIIDDSSLAFCEEVSVSFQARASVTKESFPITHQHLLNDDDLSSPEGSDEETDDDDEQADFKPLSKEAFDAFGSVMDQTLHPSVEQNEEDHISVSSADTFVVHEDQECAVMPAEMEDSLLLAEPVILTPTDKIQTDNLKFALETWNNAQQTSSFTLNIPSVIVEEDDEELDASEENVKEIEVENQVAFEEKFPETKKKSPETKKKVQNGNHSVYSPLMVSLSASTASNSLEINDQFSEGNKPNEPGLSLISDDADDSSITLTSSEIEILQGKATHMNTAGIKSSMKRPTKQMLIPVEVEGVQTVGIQVFEDTPVIDIIFKAARKAGMAPHINHTLYEVSDHFKYERHLEEHELLNVVLLGWPQNDRPRIVLRYNEKKNLLWKEPPFPMESVTQYLKNGQVPHVTSKMYFCEKGNKRKWTNGIFCLTYLGICILPSHKGSDKQKLVASIDHCLYTIVKGVTVWNKKQQLPTPFCFIVKPFASWRKRDMKVFCCENISSFLMWVNAFRLLKHGLQLKANYVALNTRITHK